MQCPYCKKDITSLPKQFCPYCGKEIIPTYSYDNIGKEFWNKYEQSNARDENIRKEQINKQKLEKKQKYSNWIILIIIIIVLVISAVYFSKKNINFNNTNQTNNTSPTMSSDQPNDPDEKDALSSNDDYIEDEEDAGSSGGDTDSNYPEDTNTYDDYVDDENSEDYIIPYSSDRLLTIQDIESLSEQELIFARNEIYARHGRKFKDDTIREYFLSKDWYEGVIEADDFSEDMLSEVEKQNAYMMLEYEKSLSDSNYQEDNVLSFNGHRYSVVRTTTIDNYWDAQLYCENLGGYLATIEDEAENKAIYKYIFYELRMESAYFGLTDDGSEGDWYWVNGEESQYRNWLQGQPDNLGNNEDYALFYYRDTPYKWNDGNFGKDEAGTVTFIVEWDN